MGTVDSILFDAQGKLKDMKLELYESSGPVAPAYQFNTHIILQVQNNEIALNYKDARIFSEGKPKESIQFQRKISVETYVQLMTEFLTLDAVKSGKNQDFVGSAKGRIGISFNVLDCQVGQDINFKVEYVLSSLEQEGFKECLKAVDWMKNLKKIGEAAG